jgi:hypothetical protein
MPDDPRIRGRCRERIHLRAWASDDEPTDPVVAHFIQPKPLLSTERGPSSCSAYAIPASGAGRRAPKDGFET